MNLRAGRSFWTVFAGVVMAGVSLFFVPAFIIRPFKYQSASALHTALVFRQIAPVGTIVAALAVVGLIWWAWRRVGRKLKVAMGLGGVLVVRSGGMARMNYFERMFPSI